MALAVVPLLAYSAQAPNPRGSGEAMRAIAAAGLSAAPASTAQNSQNVSTVPTTPANAASSRRAVAVPREVSARPVGGVIPRSATPANITARSGSLLGGTTAARSGTVARSATSARATAIFSDMTKMGSEYATCYDNYNTCMDQFCAAANNTYRRCFCSQKHKEFGDIELALSKAKELLVKFNDNNLEVVDKTAAEVKAMYSASEGEAALKRDVSASSKLLTEIENLLAGRGNLSGNRTTLDLSSVNIIDISGIWDNPENWLATNGRNISELAGMELYNEAHRQCNSNAAPICAADAAGMVRSAYSILIAQDCNAYERKLNAEKEGVMQIVRDAYKVLRAARLEEYREHNSMDMNDCLARVRGYILSDQVCGEGYIKCLDPTGMYINSNTGEPNYTPRLFNLANMITWTERYENNDILYQNGQFNQFLDTKRNFAKPALNTCLSIADDVWMEFKRAAIIEIAQAQEAAIEKIKDSCVSTMRQCYDTTGSQLAAFDITEAQASGAAAAGATSAICREKVLTCAALFCNETNTSTCPPCQMGANGQVANGEQCGLTALWNFVDAVDSMSALEGCRTALRNYARDICTSSGQRFPYGCRLRAIGAEGDSASATGSLYGALNAYANTHCKDPTTNGLIAEAPAEVRRLLNEIQEQISEQMKEVCAQYNGIWAGDAAMINSLLSMGEVELEPGFMMTVYNGINYLKQSTVGLSTSTNDAGRMIVTGVTNTGYGMCVLNAAASDCRAQNSDTGNLGFATFNPMTGDCDLDDGWYRAKCEGVLHGVWRTASKTCLYMP